MWANKNYNKYFVRIDGQGNPVYGSMIDRASKPKNGRFVEVVLKNICCTIPATSFTLAATNYALGGRIAFSIDNATGNLLDVVLNNGASHAATLTALVSYLNTNYPGFGVFSVSGDIISLAPDEDENYEDLTITASYAAAVQSTVNPAGFAASTGLTFASTGFIPSFTSAKGASLAASITTLVGTLTTNYPGLGTWTAITNGVRLDNRTVNPITIALTYTP